MKLIKNVAEWLNDSAEKYPTKIAFSNSEISFTYDELRKTALRIGSELLRRGYFKKPVFVHFNKDPRAIACFMGCAYSGNFYVPIDSDMPEQRLNALREKVQPVEELTIENYHTFAETEIDEHLLNDAMEKQIDTDLLYILFTSGSTGVPKAVSVPHRSVIDFAYRVKDVLQISDQTINGQIVDLFFDGSIAPVYTTILCGATNYLIPKKVVMFPPKLIDFLNKNKCTTFHSTPTLYAIIAKSGILKLKKPEHLVSCSFGGEVMQAAVLNEWKRFLPDVSYVNLMGPCEAIGSFCYYIVDRKFNDNEVIPVGKKYSNIDVLILNDNNELCKPNELGEICIRGSRLSFGYYNEFNKSAESFVQNPLNTAYREIIYRSGDYGYVNESGELFFHGRKDFQIKHAGRRIELGEIESVAMSLPEIFLCGCVYDYENQQIVLFYNGNMDINILRQELKQKLPSYMIPTRIDKLNSIPRTPTGKINRNALKSLL